MAIAASSLKRGHDDVGNDEPNKKLRCSPEYGPWPDSKNVDLLLKTSRASSEPVTVTVGDATYSLDEARLCSSSGYFKTTFNSSYWRKRNSKSCNISWTTSEAFRIYAKWLDGGNIYINDERLIEETDMVTDQELRTVFECYRLSSILEDDDFKDAMLDAMISIIVNENATLKDIPRVVYNSTESASPHRQFVVDYVAHTWPRWCFEEISEETYSSRFLLDLLTAMGSRLRGVTPVDADDFFQDVNTCKWHEHTKKKAPCYKDKHEASSEAAGTPCKSSVLSVVFALTNFRPYRTQSFWVNQLLEMAEILLPGFANCLAETHPLFRGIDLSDIPRKAFVMMQLRNGSYELGIVTSLVALRL